MEGGVFGRERRVSECWIEISMGKYGGLAAFGE